MTAYLLDTWRYAVTAGAGDPGTGHASVDDPVSVVSISTTTYDAADASGGLAGVVVGDRVLLQEETDPTVFSVVEVVGTPVDHVSWWELPVALVGVTGDPPTPDVVLQVGFSHPVAGAFHAYASVEDLASALHVGVTPKNEVALERALQAAATEIDHDVDRVDPMPEPYPPAIVQANIALAVEAYKLPDSAFGVLGFDDTGAIRASKDTLPRYWQLITPYKQRWGIA